MLRVRRTLFCASSMTVRVFSPRKSILRSPRSSQGPLGYWVVRSPSCKVTGTRLVISWSAMITPQACLPVLRTIPSIIRPCSTMLRATELFATSCWSSGDFDTASSREILISSGIILASLLASENSISLTRARSRTTIFAPNVPKVIMLATRSLPYFSRTYSTTSSRRRIQKSTSKSGGDTRSRLSMRSKRRPKLSGSMSVMRRT